MGALERAAMSPRMALLTWQAVTQLPDLHGHSGNHQRSDAWCCIAATRQCLSRWDAKLAATIPGARFVELAGVDHLPHVGDYKAVTGEVEEFLTGQRHEHPPDRVLATVLFTDIVDSTRRAAELGDRTMA